MKTIYKYPLKVASEQIIKLPIMAEFCHVGLDPQGIPCLWYLVETNYHKEDELIYIFGTGHEINEGNLKHLGSFIQNSFVWHVFKKIEVEGGKKF